jgi:hypothetical protein
MEEVPLVRRIIALLLALFVGGVFGFALGYGGIILIVVATFTVFNRGGGCVGHVVPWFEAASPYLIVLALICGLIGGIKIAIKVRKYVMTGG